MRKGGLLLTHPHAPQLNAGTSFYKRSFVEEVRKCDDLTRILRCIEEELDVSPPRAHMRARCVSGRTSELRAEARGPLRERSPSACLL